MITLIATIVSAIVMPSIVKRISTLISANDNSLMTKTAAKMAPIITAIAILTIGSTFI